MKLAKANFRRAVLKSAIYSLGGCRRISSPRCCALRDGPWNKIKDFRGPAVVDALGNPGALSLTLGRAADMTQAEPLIAVLQLALVCCSTPMS